MSQERPPREERSLTNTIEALTNGRVRATVVVGLSDLSRADATALAAAWRSWPEATRVAVVRQMTSLAEDRVELIFGRALRVALDDESAVVRQLAIAALWEDEGGDLIDRLLDLLRFDESQDVRAEAAEALSRFADRAVAGELDEETASELRDRLLEIAADPRSPYVLRRRSLESVAAFGQDPAVTTLIEEAFDSDEPGLRASAIHAMGRTLSGRWVDTVVAELAGEDEDAEVIYEAARASGALGDPSAVRSLAELTQHHDTDIRQAAIVALGEIGDREANRILRTLATEGPEADRELVADALAEAVGTVDLS